MGINDWVISQKEFFGRIQKGADPRPVVDFFLFEGVPFALRDWSEYCFQKKELAERLNVHAKSIVLVGSGRLGYSVSPKVEDKKLWKPFHDRSDFDFVVIDQPLFDAAWRESLLME